MVEFPRIARLGAIVTILLFVSFAFVPVVPFTVLGIEMSPVGILMARRMSALFLGIGLILFLARDEGNSVVRRAVCAGVSASMTALALFGLYDFATGGAGPGIWTAIATEAFFAAAFGFHARAAADQ